MILAKTNSYILLLAFIIFKVKTAYLSIVTLCSKTTLLSKINICYILNFYTRFNYLKGVLYFKNTKIKL